MLSAIHLLHCLVAGEHIPRVCAPACRKLPSWREQWMPGLWWWPSWMPQTPWQASWRQQTGLLPSCCPVPMLTQSQQPQVTHLQHMAPELLCLHHMERQCSPEHMQQKDSALLLQEKVLLLAAFSVLVPLHWRYAHSKHANAQRVRMTAA